MSRHPRLSPRKKPAQARSEKTVEALLAAAARILREDGYERASTNRIAHVAGVSVGSLYQYFPNKESIVFALVERHYRDMERLLRERLARVRDRPVPAIARELVHAMVAAHATDTELHRVLSHEVPRRARAARLRPLVERMRGALVDLVRGRRRELRPPDVALAMHLVTTAVEALTHDALPDLPRGVGADRWEREITDLVVRYVARDPAPTRRRPKAGRSPSPRGSRT